MESKGGAAVAEVRAEVDNLSELVSALKAAVNDGNKVAEKEIVHLTEMLMRLLLKLDGIEVEGEGRVQRKREVRRIQGFVDAMDALKTQNSNRSSTWTTAKSNGSTQESLMQRVNSLLASLSHSHSTSSSVSNESTEDSAFASAFEDFKALLAKNFNEVASKDNVYQMQRVLQILCLEPRKLHPRLINPVKDIHYLFPNMVEKWNKSHELLTMHQQSKEKLEETNKILEEYTSENTAWEEEMEALSIEEKDLEARLSAIKKRKEKIENIRKSTSEKINELISLPDVRSGSLSEIQEAIDIEQETISYTFSTWEQYRETICG